MSIRIISYTFFITIFMMLPSISTAHGQEKGKDRPIARWPSIIGFINEHEAALVLTSDQKEKLNEIAKKVEDKREQFKDDPELRDLFKQVHEARINEDEEKMKSLRKQMREAFDKKSGMSLESILLEMGKILTPDQLVKLGELRKAEGVDIDVQSSIRKLKGQQKKDSAEHVRPDPTKTPPKLYEEEF